MTCRQGGRQKLVELERAITFKVEGSLEGKWSIKKAALFYILNFKFDKGGNRETTQKIPFQVLKWVILGVFWG